MSETDSGDIEVDVGTEDKFNFQEQLYNQLTTLKDKSDSISAEICLLLPGKTLITDVTANDIKISTKIVKIELAENILSLISLCNLVCHDSTLNNISNSDHGTFKPSEAQLSEVSVCVEKSLSGFLSTQNIKFEEIDRQVAKLQSISNSLFSKLSNVGNTPEYQYDSSDLSDSGISTANEIKNTTKCVDNYVCDFISSDQSNKLVEFLDNCDQFSDKKESGHSVAMFGYPYHYTGSSHSDEPVDIPDPIQQVIEKLKVSLEMNFILRPF